jgi:hypothetical protein
MPRTTPPRSKDLIRRDAAALAERGAQTRARGTGRAPGDGDTGPGRTGGAAAGILVAALFVLGPILLGVGNAFFGHQVRDVVVAAACRFTGCGAAGMAFAGWLVLSAPLWWLAGGALFVGRWGRRARWAYGIGGALLVLVAWPFLPGRGEKLDDLLDGYGELAFATGLRWAGLSIVALIAVALAAGTLGARLPGGVRRVGGAVVAVLASLVMLGVAMSRGVMPPMTAAAMFEEPRWSVAGDTLTRVSTADRDGCAGVVANDRLLDGCLRTATASFTTDDSDAVVHLAAVLFPSVDAARAVRDGLPEGTAQMGFTGDTRTTRTVTQGWLLLTTVQHADRRDIAGDTDAGHMLWASKQVAYRFIGMQVGLLVAPEPKPPIAPRTP